MTISTQLLSDDARKLLVLLRLCDGASSVPEEVVCVLYTYGHFQGGHTTFEKLTMELESRELLKIGSTSFHSKTSPPYRMWSISPLQHIFIENEMRDEKRSMLTALSGLFDKVDSLSRVWRTSKAPTQEETMLVLCALYLDFSFAEKVASRMEIPAQRFDKLRRTTIEPISRLLGEPRSDRWTPADESAARLVSFSAKSIFRFIFVDFEFLSKSQHSLEAISFFLIAIVDDATRFLSSTRPPYCRGPVDDHLSDVFPGWVQVLMTYICNGGLHDDAISHLLGLSVLTQIPMLKALRDIASVEKTNLLNESSEGLVHALLRLFAHRDTDCSVNYAAAQAIMVLSLNDRVALIALGALDEALELLSFDVHPTLQPAPALQRRPESVEAAEKGSRFTHNFNITDSFLDSSSTSSLLQLLSVAVMVNFVGRNCQKANLRVINHPGALTQLIECLSKDSHPMLQQEAARVLCNLAATDLTRSKIANSPNALELLTLLLSKDDTPELQRSAACAFCNFTEAKDYETMLKIINCTGALHQLVQCLSKNGHPAIQELAAAALGNLASTDQTRSKISSFPNALKQLTCLLSKDNDPELQRLAARAFFYIAQGNDAGTKLKIVNCPGALDDLVRCLSKESHPPLQIAAADALVELTATGQTTSKIANCPNALEQLTALLSKDNIPELQGRAALAFRNLAATNADETNLKIVDCLGTLEQLVRCLSQEDYPAIQEHAAATLGNLASTDLTRSKIANIPNALKQLIRLMSKDNDPDLQRLAARAFFYIAQGNDAETKLKVVNCPGALDHLVGCLSKESHPALQLEAAGALVELTATDQTTSKIVNCANVLEQLTAVLSKDNIPEAQRRATLAFRNLAVANAATNADETNLKIVDCPGTLEQVVRFLCQEDHPAIQEQAAAALGNLASTDLTRLKIANFPNALKQLTCLLSKDNDPELQRLAARAFFYIAQGNDAGTKLKIVNCPGALDDLVRCLSEESHPPLQIAAAGALVELTATGQTTSKIANCPNALELLTALLSKDNIPELQGRAALAFRSLAATNADETNLKIVDCLGTLKKLVRCLSQEDHPAIQEHAAATLGNLASTDLTRSKIANFPNALKQLTCLLSKDNDPELQRLAARAFFYIAQGNDAETKLKIVNCPGALDGLVQCLTKESHPPLQIAAAGALVELTATGQPTSKIANWPNALEQLTHVLSMDDHPDLHPWAALIFCDLARTMDDESRLKIVNCLGALDQLVRSISKEDDPALQGAAVTTLSNLATTDQARSKIANCPNALDQLTAALSKDNIPDLQQDAAHTFSKLARTKDDETKLKIVNCLGALDQLVRSLSDACHPAVQDNASLALARLARVDETTLKIVNFGSVGRLKDNPVLHEHLAASAICISAMDEMAEMGQKFDKCPEQIVRAMAKVIMRILNFPGALEQLMGALRNGGNLQVQLVAARTICFLSETVLWSAADVDEKSMKIMTSEGVAEGLLGLLAEQVPPVTQGWAAAALTYVHPSRGNKAHLSSYEAYFRRGNANSCLDLYKEALADYCKAEELMPADQVTLRCRRTVRAWLEDFQGALADADNIRQECSTSVDRMIFACDLQERGIVKLKMGDLQGALADLEEALGVSGDDYEILKYRGYLAFLMKDEETAHVYAERALKIQPLGFDLPFYRKKCLGTSPVEYLNYKL